MRTMISDKLWYNYSITINILQRNLKMYKLYMTVYVQSCTYIQQDCAKMDFLKINYDELNMNNSIANSNIQFN